ncbi:hypothetical protein AAV94_12545 [Lampropedia cohaerens]|uniref:Methylated-DNA--protein-cysteine methyltransferase n=2 Tax=Lampropedia cohaerens TaxID=1610491 RepID=A0A0U1PX78_9BURK|nr:hypothetical protein AAV94_12545 [Lampropedia cohaerens]
MTHHVTIDSPIGPLLLAAAHEQLCLIQFSGERRPHLPPLQSQRLERATDHPTLGEAQRQLQEYFAGERQQFALPLLLVGTPFQQQVWQALASIPYGEAISYAELAQRVGRPTAVRAVGAANGRNPLPIVLPCHRVIGADGALTGFSGGLACKAYLLWLEGSSAPSGAAQGSRQPDLFAAAPARL